MNQEHLEKRLDKIENQLAEIHEVFQAVKGGLQTIEFLGRVSKALLPMVIFCGILWGSVDQFFKGR